MIFRNYDDLQRSRAREVISNDLVPISNVHVLLLHSDSFSLRAVWRPLVHKVQLRYRQYISYTVIWGIDSSNHISDNGSLDLEFLSDFFFGIRRESWCFFFIFFFVFLWKCYYLLSTRLSFNKRGASAACAWQPRWSPLDRLARAMQTSH